MDWEESLFTELNDKALRSDLEEKKRSFACGKLIRILCSVVCVFIMFIPRNGNLDGAESFNGRINGFTIITSIISNENGRVRR